MIAIEIRLNGVLKATCGASDVHHLMAMVSAKPQQNQDDPRRFVAACSGIRSTGNETEEVLKWVSACIAVGDEVSFKLVEASHASEPIDRQGITKQHE
jgi:hypothetical protein